MFYYPEPKLTIKKSKVFISKISKKNQLSLKRKLANNMSSFFETSFLNGMRQFKDKISIEEVARELLKKNPSTKAINEALGWEKLDFNLAPMKDSYTKTIARAAANTQKNLVPKVIKPNLIFDINNPRVSKYISSEIGKRITNLSRETKGSVMDIVRGAVFDINQYGIPHRKAAKNLIGDIGLNQPQANALLNYREKLKAANIPLQDYEKMVGKYRDKLLRDRAEMVARTEAMDAANTGEIEVWNQAADQGLVDPDKSTKTWEAGGGSCEICQAMDGVTVPINDPFILPDGDSVYAPPAHPNCSCTITTNIEVKE